MSPGGLLSTGTGATFLTAGADLEALGFGADGVDLLLEAPALGVVSADGVFEPLQAATAVAATNSAAARESRVRKQPAADLFIEPSWTNDDETTVRAGLLVRRQSFDGRGARSR